MLAKNQGHRSQTKAIYPEMPNKGNTANSDKDILL